MIISLIVAMDGNRGIGHHGRLPWRLSADLKHFKALTMGHHLILGRKTFESIGRSLPGRTMIVLSRQTDYASRLPAGILTAHSLDDALKLAEGRAETEAFVIGGGEIYSQAIPRADRIYLTRVHITVPADVFFPAFNEETWSKVEIQSVEADESNEYAFTIFRMER